MDSRELFARLRDQLAHLYGTEADARIVVADAGLDATNITFSTNARANWHAILQAGVKTEQVATLLLVVSKDYGANHDFQALYQAYRTFVTAGGRLTAPSQPSTGTGGIDAGSDVIIATVGDGAQHVVIGKEIYVGSGGAPAALTRAAEIAYLNALLKDYQYWAEKYTPLAGIAEVRVATVAGLRLVYDYIQAATADATAPLT